jgi:hypothetical protein
MDHKSLGIQLAQAKADYFAAGDAVLKKFDFSGTSEENFRKLLKKAKKTTKTATKKVAG